MRCPTFLALAALGLAASAPPASAGTLFVPQQFPTIQAAVSAAKPYDTVLISPKPKGGVYNEAVSVSTPHLVLQGRGNPVLDGAGLSAGLELRAGFVAVRGLTLQNYHGSPGNSIVNAINTGLGDIEIRNVTVRDCDAGITVNNFQSQTLPKNVRILGCTVTGTSYWAAFVNGVDGVQITGCRLSENTGAGLLVGSPGSFGPATTHVFVSGDQLSGNGLDGLKSIATGLVVSGCEIAFNQQSGMTSETLSQQNPPPAASAAPSAVSFNFVHDNGGYGLTLRGTHTVTANALSRNTGYGLSLYRAAHSVVSYNVISGTVFTPGPLNSFFTPDPGTGVYASDPDAGPVTLFGNQISGNAGDGIYLDYVTGASVSYNNVTGNGGIGIHLSDYPSAGDTPNTVTRNRAVYNTLFDARDDSNAAADITYNGYTSTGDNYAYGPSINVWTKNLFGTTDPVGLSK